MSAANAMFRAMVAEALRMQTEGRPDLVDKVIPTYPIGGKRALLDNGVWIAALKRPNVELVTDAITEITESGIITADGTARDFDVIIYGTGFHASRFLYPMKIKGRGGADLHDTWDGDARAYLGMTTPGFPNLFMIYGPNTNIVVNGSIIFFSECSVRYILGCLKLLAETGANAMEPKAEVHDAFNIQVDAGNRLMAWAPAGVELVQEREGPGQPELALRPGGLLARHPGARSAGFRAVEGARDGGVGRLGLYGSDAFSREVPCRSSSTP
uniref:Cyclohexanone monooxygenase n=1 Tax=Phenylobacterium glaciei TaxID=2803784 RepID=A0A974P184_9CAUL|nr:hypothetical protein JKL49_15750 [Phenylobacterium glaciei]